MSSSRDRALSIVELLARNVGGLPLSEIADRLAIPRSATHRLLTDLKETGYVRQDRDGGVYSLTVKLVALGLADLGATGFADLVQPVLAGQAERTGELVMLSVIEGDRLARVAKAQGARRGLYYNPDEGSDVYLAATSNGHAWLSCLGDDAALEPVARQGLKRDGYGPNAPRTMRDVVERVRQAREQGFAIVRESYEPGTSTIAAPIRRPGTGEPMRTLSIAGPSVRMTLERMRELAPSLLEAAGELAVAASGVGERSRFRSQNPDTGMAARQRETEATQRPLGSMFRERSTSRRTRQTTKGETR